MDSVWVVSGYRTTQSERGQFWTVCWYEQYEDALHHADRWNRYFERLLLAEATCGALEAAVWRTYDATLPPEVPGVEYGFPQYTLLPVNLVECA